MTDFISNINDHFTYSHGYDKVYRGNHGAPSIKLAKVINVSRENHLAQTYDLELIPEGAPLLGCRYMSHIGGFNGIGTYAPLEEGTFVSVTTNSGMWDDSYIVGAVYLEGDHNKYYEEGKLQEPGELASLQNLTGEYNQPSGHPNRIVQPDAYFNIYGTKNLVSGFNSPEFATNLEDKAKANPLPGSIEMRNQVGDMVNYASGNIVNYTDSNNITVSAGTNETKCAKLLVFAQYYSRQAELLNGAGTQVENTQPEPDSKTGLIPVVTTVNSQINNSSLRSPFDNQYFVDQYRRLSQLYLQQAQSCNQGDAARQILINQMQENLGSELSTDPTVPSPTGSQPIPSYKPKEESSRVADNNFGNRSNTRFKPLLVIHETVITADQSIAVFQNPAKEVSYHALIRLNGNIVYLVDPKKRAFGAAPSQFNGEFDITNQSQTRSVNNFAYHVSFETPADGQGINGAKSNHSGYTDAQYNSLAWLASRTGIPLTRITTHKGVDIGQGKIDPRNFDRSKFERLFNSYPKTKTIFFGIGNE